MVFDSSTFLIFFAIFLVPYYLLWKSHRWQNVVLLIASCVFYGWWDWRFLGLMFCTSAVDFFSGILLGRPYPQGRRRLILFTSLAVNLGVLFVFKYFDFFACSLRVAFASLGLGLDIPSLKVVLPVGISFYTFQSISYAVDVYRRDVEPERNPVSYFTFVCCFPHLVAGPIQRAHHLLDQLNRPRIVTEEGLKEAAWLLAWGFFLKQVVANSAAPFVSMAFREDQTNGWMTILGTAAFSIQIYCDFNAYSSIARGVGRLIGLEFIWNFNLPYFASSVQDFWRRWHISLSTWLRDYLYIPLGGSRKGTCRTYINLILTMLLGGLWHGAAWTFVLWGLLHGLALAVGRALNDLAPRLKIPAVIGWAGTMSVVGFGWLLFRCQTWSMFSAMTASLGHLEWRPIHGRILGCLTALAVPVLLVEVWQYRKSDLAVPIRSMEWRFAALTAGMALATFGMFNRLSYGFIYFQF